MIRLIEVIARPLKIIKGNGGDDPLMRLLPIMMLMNGGGESEADSNAMANFLPLMLMMSEEKTDEDGNVVSRTSSHKFLSRY